MDKLNFIKTRDNETANELRANNLQELPKEGNYFVFVNKTDTQIFSSNKNKIIKTNRIFV